MAELSNPMCNCRNSGQFSTIHSKDDKVTSVSSRFKFLNFGHDVNRLYKSSKFFISQPSRKVSTLCKSFNDIKSFEITQRFVLIVLEEITRLFRECDHFEETIVMEGVKRSSGLPNLLIDG